MCRNIKPLFNFDPAATEEEIRNASLQYVRKVAGTNRPSKMNEDAFEKAVAGVTIVTRNLLNSLSTNATPRNREVEAARAKERNAKRFGVQ